MERTALVTGASNGIGYELTKLLAADGYDLVLVARSTAKLQAIAEELQSAHGVRVQVIGKDLGDPQAPEEIFQTLQAAGTQVDVLVNNAGFGVYGEFTEVDLAEHLGMIQLNIAALTHLTKRFLTGMIERRRGRILNVASTAAFQPGPLMSVYYASKAYVLSFSEALADEVAAKGVTVTALCPGPTHTGFEGRAKMEQAKLFKSGVMDARTVARIGYEGMKKGRTLVISGMKNRVLAQSIRFVPRKTVLKLVRKIQG